MTTFRTNYKYASTASAKLRAIKTALDKLHLTHKGHQEFIDWLFGEIYENPDRTKDCPEITKHA